MVDALERYSRQTLLPEIGREGQERLLSSTVAIIGCGGFVRYHVRGIKEGARAFRCVGLADNVREHAERLAAEHFPDGRPGIYTDYAKMLKEVRPDAVIV